MTKLSINETIQYLNYQGSLKVITIAKLIGENCKNYKDHLLNQNLQIVKERSKKLIEKPKESYYGIIESPKGENIEIFNMYKRNRNNSTTLYYNVTRRLLINRHY